MHGMHHMSKLTNLPLSLMGTWLGPTMASGGKAVRHQCRLHASKMISCMTLSDQSGLSPNYAQPAVTQAL